MELRPGTRLGPYEVIAPLGSGGMGEVYRARDTRLGREVAVKVLPAERLSDPARRARFVQEARAASALNHPNIVTIHEIESVEGIDFIVMELVPGCTLDDLIPQQGMRLGEALRIAIPLADALAAAHAAGIVHRDLKPGNVMVRPDGVVKVLDFGLAKLLRGDTGSSDKKTTTMAGDAGSLSRPGAVMGTTGYMSPEQASGGSVDARSDVFSFGVLLYEMVTGRRAFAGDSSAEVLAALLKDTPKPPRELVPDVPKELERIILRCLRKEQDRRFQHMLDVKIELQELKEESDSQAAAPEGGAIARRRSRRHWWAWATAGGVILAAAAALTLWRLERPEPPKPRLVQLSWTGKDGEGTFSPDGSQIAFESKGERGDNWDIWVKIVGEAEARRLTTDPAADYWPAWSPDGKQIAFVRLGPRTGSIYLVSPVVGSERRLADFPAGGRLSWSPDGRWLAAGKAGREGETAPESSGIHLIPAGGGDPRAVTFPKPPAFDCNPAFSPDGRTLAYASCSGLEGRICDVYVVALDGTLRPASPARALTQQGVWVLGVAWTRDGRSILYGSGTREGVWRVPADGGFPPERVELAGRGAYAPAIARSQDRLVFVRDRFNADICRLQQGRAPAPLIESTYLEAVPQYSPDGERIAFESGRSGETQEIWLADADGTNPARLTRGPGRSQGSPRWSPDGRSVTFDSQGQDGRWDVWTIGIDGAGLRQLTRDPSDDTMASFSRDGRWVYFTSNRTGRHEVWRVPAAGGAEEQVTRGGGCWPFESFDGRTLYYKRTCGNDALLGRPTSGGTERTILPCVVDRSWAVAPQGLFHVDCNPPETPAPTQVVLRYRDATTGQDRPFGTFEAASWGGLSASPDARSVLYVCATPWITDLMMIENFR
jgi:eukaryotic-like serine/threonine-protein kinase